MEVLENWDFDDAALNSALIQQNRQKSATSLVVLHLDRHAPQASFADPKRRQDHTATLKTCTCNDFSFAGKHPRKTFAPCMHVYRLAMELGILEPRYLNSDDRRHAFVLMKQYEVERLQRLPRDGTQWGAWDARVHVSGIQKNRQYRARFILEDDRGSVFAVGRTGKVNDYTVSLGDCECGDFLDRQLPCKHIYTLAILADYPIPLSHEDYRAGRQAGKEVVFRFEDA